MSFTFEVTFDQSTLNVQAFELSAGSPVVLSCFNEHSPPLPKELCSRHKMIPGSGVLSLKVVRDGPTRVLRIVDIRYKPSSLHQGVRRAMTSSLLFLWIVYLKGKLWTDGWKKKVYFRRGRYAPVTLMRNNRRCWNWLSSAAGKLETYRHIEKLYSIHIFL